ncbi:MAG TPA: DUF2721 domain-containing protein [Pyrinomonadaceae bacterium]|nr:DUF2721 domain-containing protein [Pyrinomonadaceae bacterium]
MAGEILNMNPNALSSTIEFLTAMITPALLISATGSMVLSTSTRLGRVIDRVRQLTCQLEDLITLEDKNKVPLYDKKLEMTFKLLDKVTSRSRILQKAMVAFYNGLGFFVLTSVSIGIVGILGIYRWFPIPVGLVGILFLFYGSILMLREARMATDAINSEMDYTWDLARQVAPEDIADRLSKRGWTDKQRRTNARISFRAKIQNALTKR